jgi:hypothetical protein
MEDLLGSQWPVPEYPGKAAMPEFAGKFGRWDGEGAPISISESRPNPASATDRAKMAATASTTIPATFHASVTYSRTKPRRSTAARVASSAIATA